MATLKAIRKRISSVRNTQQITKAMKMVSAAKLHRAQEAVERARPYAEKMVALLKNLSSRTPDETHPLLTDREENRIELILLTSDRGLCGGYNSTFYWGFYVYGNEFMVAAGGSIVALSLYIICGILLVTFSLYAFFQEND